MTSVPHGVEHQITHSFPDLETVVRDVCEEGFLHPQTSQDKTSLAAGCHNDALLNKVLLSFSG